MSIFAGNGQVVLEMRQYGDLRCLCSADDDSRCSLFYPVEKLKPSSGPWGPRKLRSPGESDRIDLSGLNV